MVENNTPNLKILKGSFAICALPKNQPELRLDNNASFLSITKTPEETSLVCEENNVPEGTECEKGWSALKIDSKLDFSDIGVLAEIVDPLAVNDISIFTVSTFNTDYLFVKAENLEKTKNILIAEGFAVNTET